MEEFVRWGAPAFTTFAALMTASNLGSRVTGWGFAVFLAGSILWTTLGLLTGQPNLVWQNVILTLLNVFGMWRWLGRQAKIDDGGQEAQARSAVSAEEPLFPASLLTTAKIVGPGGREVGHAVAAMAGCHSGSIAYVVAGEGGVAGVGEKLHRLDWRHVMVEADRLRTKLSSLEGLETLKEDHWPVR